MLCEDRACSPSAPPGLFYKQTHVKIAICKQYLSICFVTEWPCRISVLLPQLALNEAVWCGSMVWHHGYVLPWSLSATFCSSVKGMVPRNKTIRFDFIWALQNFCSFWYFSSIFLSICLHTSECMAFVLHQALGITSNSLRVNYIFGIYIVTFCTYTTFCTTISTAYLYTVWKKTQAVFFWSCHLTFSSTSLILEQKYNWGMINQ